MPISSIRLVSFRNLADGELDLGASRIFLVGENGQGKTNLLEAVYYLSYASSFRGQVDTEIARSGLKEFALQGEIVREESPDLPPESVSVSWKAKSKEVRRGGKALRDRKELIELNPAIVYCHEDFAFAAGEPERRRFFFDQAASLVSLAYLDLLRDYRKVLAQRNAALREGRSGLLPILDWQLAEKGVRLMEERESMAADFSRDFVSHYEVVAKLGISVELAYRPSWREGAASRLDDIVSRLEGKRAEEEALKTSLSGPHRDRWTFLAGGRDFTATASTGQLRLLSLVLRSSQARFYSARTGRNPLLLLDDVLLELDQPRRRRFFDTLPASSQAIFTFLPGEDWEGYRDSSSLVYRVENGGFTHQVGP